MKVTSLIRTGQHVNLTREEWLQMAHECLKQAHTMDHSQNEDDYATAKNAVRAIIDNPREDATQR